MAAETPTGSTEARALSAALGAPAPFAGRAASLALHASDRHVDRWAPERDAVKRSRSLGALSFVDRLLQPWLTATAPTAAMARPTLGGGAGERAQAVSWIFPRPWYQDELDWMAAAREAELNPPSRGALTTSGTFAVATSMPARDARQAVVVVADQPLRRGPAPAASLEYVAPSLGGTARSPDSAEAPAPVRALRAWSPQVSFAATQAAEVMAATVAATEHAGMTVAQRSPVLEGLAYVAPAELADVGATPERGRAAPQLARAVAQLAAAQAVSHAAPTAEASRAAIAQVAPVAAPVTTPAASAADVAPSAAELAYREEHARVIEAAAQPAAAAPTAFETLVSTAQSSPAAAQAMRGVELLARAAIGGGVAPASGPRVAMPAGLGGALVGFEAARTTHHAMVGADVVRAPDELAASPERARTAPVETPVVAPRAFSPVWARVEGGTPALAAVASERPTAMTHLAWADRWLARIAGASPASLTALDVAAEHRAPALRALSSGAPEIVYVLPELAALTGDPLRAPAARTAAPSLRSVPPPAELGSRAAAAAPASRPADEAPRIDDHESTPDEVFAAIARAARPGRKAAPTTGDAPRAPEAPPQLREVRADAAPPFHAKPTLADAIARTAPAAPAAGLHAGLASSPMAAALAGLLPMQSAPVFDPRAMFAGGLLSAYVGGAMARDVATGAAADLLAPTLGVAARAPGVTYVSPDAPEATAAGEARPAATASPVRAVRSPVLALPGLPRSAASPSLEAPLTHVDAAAWSPRPGMTAELAQGFSIDHERTAADLSFDFVAPEQVLAARVYGFGAVEAAQAARLAVAGPTGLSAMASALDLQFLRQLHVAAEESGAQSAGARAATGGVSPRAAAAPAMTPIVTAWPAITRSPDGSETTGAGPVAAPSGTVFGVERRLPRGAFLWPAGVVAALDLRADMPEGAAATSIAALELLAAGAVAQIGQIGGIGGGARTPTAPDDADAEPAAPARLAAAAPEMTLTAPTGAAEPSGTEIAETAAALPAPQRARFEAIYQSLSRSSAGQALSPSVRAARALAIAAAQDGATGDGGSAHERARAAWAVMPAVYAGGAAAPEARRAAPGARSAPELTVVSPASPYGDDAGAGDEMRPGLSRLAARAGEAIGSYVQPSAGEVTQASSGAAHVPSSSGRSGSEPFVHELIRTGRGFSRVGGGETEIPAWFESAARKMLEQRGLGETMSVAELTLIASSPSRQVAAAARDAGGGPAPSMAQASPGASGGEAEKPDIEKISAEVYAEILKLIDIARERSGDPWL
jgi:hypothetical protein